jgi:cell division septation protein DedD
MVRRKRKLHFKNASSKFPILIFSVSVVIGSFFLFRIISTLINENGNTVKFTPVKIQSVTPTKMEGISAEREIAKKSTESLRDSVKKTVEKPAVTNQKEQVKSPPASEYYTIQVASFKNRKRAEDLIKQLKEREFSPLYIRTRGNWFEVCVGKFESREEGGGILSKLRKDFFDAFTRKLQPPFEEM